MHYGEHTSFEVFVHLKAGSVGERGGAAAAPANGDDIVSRLLQSRLALTAMPCAAVCACRVNCRAYTPEHHTAPTLISWLHTRRSHR